MTSRSATGSSWVRPRAKPCENQFLRSKLGLYIYINVRRFEAITNTKNQDDIDYTETILKPMESLWASVRLPLLIPVLMLAYECRTAVVAAAGAIQGLFAAAPEPVAEPAKRGLFALFGR